MILIPKVVHGFHAGAVSIMAVVVSVLVTDPDVLLLAGSTWK